MAPIGIAIVGGGIFVKEEHLPAVLASPLLSLKAIYSRSLKSAQDTANLVPGATEVDIYSSDSGPGRDYADLLERADVHAVILALPIMAQPEYIEKALLAGKHVLSEKPIGPHLALAQKLIAFYRRLAAETNLTWAVAENIRFTPVLQYAAEQVKSLGKVHSFSVKICFMMPPDSKWIKTEWRKKPEYQGGFILDAGVHFTAAMRLLLGPDAAVEAISAYSSLVQDYLAPVDTVNAIVKTKSGAVGSFTMSVGSTAESDEFQVVCEKGYITGCQTKVTGGQIKATVTRIEGEERKTETKDFQWCSGVKEEVHAWAESLAVGKPNPNQSPEQALADLELLEKMLKSHGSQQTMQFQSAE